MFKESIKQRQPSLQQNLSEDFDFLLFIATRKNTLRFANQKKIKAVKSHRKVTWKKRNMEKMKHKFFKNNKLNFYSWLSLGAQVTQYEIELT